MVFYSFKCGKLEEILYVFLNKMFSTINSVEKQVDILHTITPLKWHTLFMLQTDNTLLNHPFGNAPVR